MSSQLKKQWRLLAMAENTPGEGGGTDATYMEWLLEKNLAVQTALFNLVSDYLRPQEGSDEPEDQDGADPE